MSAYLLKKGDVAERLGVTTRTVENWVSAGKIPAPVKLGTRMVRWSAEAFEEWIRGGMKPVATTASV